MRLTAILPFLMACEGLPTPGTIDGLPATDNLDIVYIEWVTVPPTSATDALIKQFIGDSERHPVAFVSAAWCGSCKAYKATLASERMKAVHAKVQILELDLDHHTELLKTMGIRPVGVPHWEGLATSGQSSGLHMDGRAWSTDTLDAMAPVLEHFFARLDDA